MVYKSPKMDEIVKECRNLDVVITPKNTGVLEIGLRIRQDKDFVVKPDKKATYDALKKLLEKVKVTVSPRDVSHLIHTQGYVKGTTTTVFIDLDTMLRNTSLNSYGLVDDVKEYIEQGLLEYIKKERESQKKGIFAALGPRTHIG